MNKLLSCRYNMDTNRVEARFEGGTTVAIDWTSTATPRHSGQSWTGCCTISPWSMPSLCWVVRLSIISRLAVTIASLIIKQAFLSGHVNINCVSTFSFYRELLFPQTTALPYKHYHEVLTLGYHNH